MKTEKKVLKCIIQIGRSGLMKLIQGKRLEVEVGEVEPIDIYFDVNNNNFWSSSHDEIEK